MKQNLLQTKSVTAVLERIGLIVFSLASLDLSLSVCMVAGTSTTLKSRFSAGFVRKVSVSLALLPRTCSTIIRLLAITTVTGVEWQPTGAAVVKRLS